MKSPKSSENWYRNNNTSGISMKNNDTTKSVRYNNDKSELSGV